MRDFRVLYRNRGVLRALEVGHFCSLSTQVLASRSYCRNSARSPLIDTIQFASASHWRRIASCATSTEWLSLTSSRTLHEGFDQLCLVQSPP